MSISSFLLLGLPLLARASLDRRDDASDGGGDPQSGDAPQGNGLSNWVEQPGKAPVQPLKDPWYTTQFTNLTSYKTGTIISHRYISVSSIYQGIEQAFQLKYRTEDAHDAAALSFASVLIPHAREGNGNIIVYQLPEAAISQDCAPTYQLFKSSSIAEIQSLITQGFVVVVPDYEGQRGSFTVGKLSGKQILDAARAALTAPGVRTGAALNIGLWGYGTAAHATGWAAEIASTYAPELPIRAVALGGLIVDLLSWINAVNNSSSAASVVTSLLGMGTEYADVSEALANYVLPHRRSLFQDAASHCAEANDLIFFGRNITASFFTEAMNVFEVPKVKKVYEINSLGKTAPRASVYVYQGSNDAVAPIASVRTLLNSYCSNGTSVSFHEITGASHSQARTQYGNVLDYLVNALTSGAITANSCIRIKNGGYTLQSI